MHSQLPDIVTTHMLKIYPFTVSTSDRSLPYIRIVYGYNYAGDNFELAYRTGVSSLPIAGPLPAYLDGLVRPGEIASLKEIMGRAQPFESVGQTLTRHQFVSPSLRKSLIDSHPELIAMGEKAYSYSAANAAFRLIRDQPFTLPEEDFHSHFMILDTLSGPNYTSGLRLTGSRAEMALAVLRGAKSFRTYLDVYHQAPGDIEIALAY